MATPKFNTDLERAYERTSIPAKGKLGKGSGAENIPGSGSRLSSRNKPKEPIPKLILSSRTELEGGEQTECFPSTESDEEKPPSPSRSKTLTPKHERKSKPVGSRKRRTS